ncbi:hypothetical protein T12_1350 [Trichinella patagoniensis]|uniref:Uncharacterized protein n=1 Tax=Trichinella patagoniensis TaxID=990121 RepID=A0A0V0YXT9_9BILA|nr:hypothetical protein T12_1350 [Trichinella patagoniensis]
MTEERLNRLAAICTFILTFPLILTCNGEPWKGSEFVAAIGKLYLIIRLTILLGSRGNLKLGRKSSASRCARKSRKRRKHKRHYNTSGIQAGITKQ